jgi:hypothetical protein
MTVSWPDPHTLLLSSEIRIIRWARHGIRKWRNSSQMVRRYLRNAVAWTSAINYIFQGVTASPSFKNITLDFVVTPLASPDTCAPENEFMDTAITYMLEKLSIDRHSEAAESLINRLSEKVLPVKFSGTVHCEASLMGMIIACKDDTMPLPDGMKREELEAFKVPPSWIYVPYLAR